MQIHQSSYSLGTTKKRDLDEGNEKVADRGIAQFHRETRGLRDGKTPVETVRKQSFWNVVHSARDTAFGCSLGVGAGWIVRFEFRFQR
jgi:hypothetical protein